MKNFFIGVCCLFFCLHANAQKVTYTEPDRNDSRGMDFDIIGKIAGNILVYKTIRANFSISVYDAEMKLKNREALLFLPDRVINTDFLVYPDFCYFFYQYQKKNVVYAMAAKFDANGKQVGKEIVMDTTEVGFLANNKIYSIENSEDKQYISLFKINSKNDERFVVTTLLYDKDLTRKEKQRLIIAMPENHDYLTEFLVDNDGDFCFVRAVQESENDKASDLYLYVKKQGSALTDIYHIELNKLWLDDVRLKADNFNKHIIISSFFSKTRRSNIEGMYTCVWNKATATAKAPSTAIFDDELRSQAKGDNGTKAAFNDYYIRNMIVRKDGGFLLAAESFFSTSRGGYNRYDYMYGSPFLRSMDYYSYGPLSYGYPWYRYNSLGQNVRYNSQNVAVFSFDSTGQTNWTNILNKSQYDDESDAFIGYSLVNTGDQLYFVYNQQERRLQLLSAQAISPSGKISRTPTFRNLDQGYDFMARYGKQTGQRQIIFPCMYRNYLCFAKVDF